MSDDKLSKAYERSVDGQTLVDPREYFGALASADKEHFQWLSDNVKGLNDGDSKILEIPNSKSKLKIRKLANDMYSGWVIKDNGDISHLFDRLTLPVVVAQIISVEELYTAKQPPTLQDELKSLGEAIKELREKNVPDDDNKKSVEQRLASLIEKLSEIDDLVNAHRDNVRETVLEADSAISHIHEKLHTLHEKVENDLTKPQSYVVDKISDPESCSDCNQNDCICYSHLSKPCVEIEPNGKIKITFGTDYNNLDRLNYLKQMKYAVDKKRTDGFNSEVAKPEDSDSEPKD